LQWTGRADPGALQNPKPLNIWTNKQLKPRN